VACTISDEIVRTFVADWTAERAQRLRRGAIVWCASMAFVILGWLFVRQMSPETLTTAVAGADLADAEESSSAPTKADKPKLLIAVMTPVNLLTGIVSCGLICVLTVWMDRRWLPPKLRPPAALTGFNLICGLLFLALGLKGGWEDQSRLIAFGGVAGLLIVAIIIAALCRPKLRQTVPPSVAPTGELAS
jgi:hypothetical protein